MKLDIGEFFLSGEHDFLINAVAKFFSDKEKRCWVVDALYCLCHYQVVEFESVCYRITKGSGMGTKHSGALSNLAFSGEVELPFFGSLASRGLAVLAYCRFFDDILMILPDEGVFDDIIALFKSKARPHFTIEVDAVSNHAVPMLDMLVRKRLYGQDCKIVWRPYVKPTALHLPLHHESLHIPATHVSWPIAEMRRLHQLSTFSHEFEHARNLKLARWSQFFLHSCVLESCKQWKPAVAPRARVAPSVRTVRFILPHHPSMRSLQGPLKDLCAVWSSRVRHRFNFEVDISLTWRSAGVPLHIMLRRACL